MEMKVIESDDPPILDRRQLTRIEAVHRGYLYQHLYTAACLLSAQQNNVKSIVVERDEDVELVFAERRIYVQVKTRSEALTGGDIDGALKRFDALRLQHKNGVRSGSANFVIAVNVRPGPILLKRMASANWPADVQLHWPDSSEKTDEHGVLPLPWRDISDALVKCAELAATLPFGLLAPETLVGKLAGFVALAATGTPPRTDHAFKTDELPQLFEQLVVQLQDFPAPPSVYRAQDNEPPLVSSERVRIITGYSGAGKTSWVSQAAIHATGTVTYFDVGDTPGPALISTLARDLAARLFGKSGGGLGKVLLPGASGAEILQSICARIAVEGEDVTVVLDNAHHAPPTDLQMLIQKGPNLKFLLLCQPGSNVAELEALLTITSEPLRGWAPDTVASEANSRGCQGDYAACQRLVELTAGMPLYVQNAMAITAVEYGGAVAKFCDNLEAKTHTVETAQEIILRQVFERFPATSQDGIGALSLSDIPLQKDEVTTLLKLAFGLDDKAIAAILRQLRSAGVVEVFGGDRLKIHDAMRLLGQSHLDALGKEVVRKTQITLKDLLSASLRQQWEMAKLSLFIRMLAALGDVKTLVEVATDELFHELGVMPELRPFLENAAASEESEPEDRFWALDGLIFADMKAGDNEAAILRQIAMGRLIAEHNLGTDERLAYEMKRMNVLAREGKADEVLATISEISELLPDKPVHQRIFKYNAAHALYDLGVFEGAAIETAELIEEYYDLIGIQPENMVGKNADKIWPVLIKYTRLTDDLKHLADCLDLHAKALQDLGRISPFARINAMKFYQMANALDSLIRVGQDLVDEFVGRHDFIGAREIIETNLLPNVIRLKLAAKIIPVRSQYAVVLAYCEEFDAADAEMARLAPYEAGLDEKGQWELKNQRKAIAKIRRDGPPGQLVLSRSVPVPMPREKVGRNTPCPCGSGQKFKKCHGRNR